MKAVVLEVKDGKAIVLTDEGLTKKVKYAGQCGDEIELTGAMANVTPIKKKRIAGAIAAAVAVSVIAGGVYSQSLTQTDTYVALNEEEKAALEINEEVRNSDVDAGSCLESEEDSEKKTDNEATEVEKVEEKAAKEEETEEPEETEKNQTQKQSAQQKKNNPSVEDAALLYQMQQQYTVEPSIGQQEVPSTSAPAISSVGTGTQNKKQNDVEISSQALASEDASEQGSTETSETAQPAGDPVVAPAAPEQQEVPTPEQEAAEASESAKKAAEDIAAQTTTIQSNTDAENIGTVPEE